MNTISSSQSIMTRNLDAFRYEPVVEVPDRPDQEDAENDPPERFPSALPIHKPFTGHYWTDEERIAMLCGIRWSVTAMKLLWT